MRELAEFFGAPVLVQFREALVLGAPSDKKTQYMPIDELGKPRVGETREGFGIQAAQATEPREQTEKVDGEERPKFTFFVKARLLPAPGERVQVLYEVGGFIVKTSVHPRDIVAVTCIEGSISDESRIVAPRN